MYSKPLLLFVVAVMLIGQTIGDNVPCDVSGSTVCGPYGTCEADLASKTNMSCVCDTQHFSITNTTACATKRKSQTTATLLQVFLGGFGAGAFYLGWILQGALIFIVIGVSLFVICCSGVFCEEENVAATSSVMASLSGLGVLVVWVYTLVQIVQSCYSHEETSAGTVVHVPCY